MKRTKSKAARGLVTRTIKYRDSTRPHSRNQELKVDVRRDDTIDHNYLVGVVALRTGLELSRVVIVRID